MVCAQDYVGSGFIRSIASGAGIMVLVFAASQNSANTTLAGQVFDEPSPLAQGKAAEGFVLCFPMHALKVAAGDFVAFCPEFLGEFAVDVGVEILGVYAG